nr:MAG TPA: hypothetical protein [Caudoviricetes sp.]
MIILSSSFKIAFSPEYGLYINLTFFNVLPSTFNYLL